jgi:hypothetical protein
LVIVTPFEKFQNPHQRPHGCSVPKHSLENSEWAFINHPRVSSDTLSIDALAIVAAFVRLSALDILFTPDFDLAIVFNVRTSSFDHERRTTFFFFISVPFLRTGLVSQQGRLAMRRCSSVI